jgi:hypothetical protein
MMARPGFGDTTDEWTCPGPVDMDIGADETRSNNGFTWRQADALRRLKRYGG